MHVKYVTFTFRGAWASDLLPEVFNVRKKKSVIELQTRQNTISGRTCIVELISQLFFFHKKSVGNREGRGTSGLFHDNKKHCYFVE